MSSRRRHLLVLAALPLAVAACEAMPGAARQPQRYVVFFTEDSAALNENGEQVILNAAAGAMAQPSAPVTVLGFAGSQGSAAFNQALSDARARHVADRLVQAGVARSRIQVRPRGPVPFDLVPVESRRVEIVIGG